jgi:hypothetical protein
MTLRLIFQVGAIGRPQFDVDCLLTLSLMQRRQILFWTFLLVPERPVTL